MTSPHDDDTEGFAASPSPDAGVVPYGGGPIGDGNHVVLQGECMESIAFDAGFIWQSLWDMAENAAVKAARKNPNALLPGDRVFVPPVRVKQVDRAPAARHPFTRKGVPSLLTFQLLDGGKPRVGLPCLLKIDGDQFPLTTDGDGLIRHPVSPDVSGATLVVNPDGPAPSDDDDDDDDDDGDDSDDSGGDSPPPDPNVPPRQPPSETYVIELRGLDPITEPSGVQARLANLGYGVGPIDGIIGPHTRDAIARFQTDQKDLTVTGKPDDPTVQRLQSVYES